MRRIVLALYIRALERYLNFPKVTSFSNTTQDFLSNAWAHAGFREYVKKRNDEIIYEAAGGAGMAPHDRVKYTELSGRRVENLYLSAMAKKSFELMSQNKRQKSE